MNICESFWLINGDKERNRKDACCSFIYCLGGSWAHGDLGNSKRALKLYREEHDTLSEIVIIMLGDSGLQYYSGYTAAFAFTCTGVWAKLLQCTYAPRVARVACLSSFVTGAAAGLKSRVYDRVCFNDIPAQELRDIHLYRRRCWRSVCEEEKHWTKSWLPVLYSPKKR